MPRSLFFYKGNGNEFRPQGNMGSARGYSTFIVAFTSMLQSSDPQV